MVAATLPTTSLDGLLRQVAFELQLPPYLDENVRQHYDALASLLAESALQAQRPNLYAQGSFRIGTTVKPVASEEFDLDFICELQAPVSMDPQEVYDGVAQVVEGSARYAGKVERKPRCIRITFSEQCHVDIVPAIPVGRPGTFIRIPDRIGEQWSWKSTNPRGYVAWFASLHELRHYAKSASVEPLPASQAADEKSFLQIGVQLAKRNHQLVVDDADLRTPSIVLTTIAGHHAAQQSSIAVTFDTICGAVAGHAARKQMILHPANPDEEISEKWNKPDVFEAFQEYSRTANRQWAAVRRAEGQGYPALAPLLYEMFGEGPVQRAFKVIGERTRALREVRGIATVGGGAISSVRLGTGNPRSTFYGRPS